MSSLILWLFYLFSIPNVYLISTQHADSALYPFESQTSLLKTVQNKKKYAASRAATNFIIFCDTIFPLRMGRCSTTGKPTHLFRTKCASLDSV